MTPVLRGRHHHIIYKEIRGLRLPLSVCATEQECNCFPLVGCKDSRNIETLLHPVIADVGIAALLQHTNGRVRAALQLADKIVETLPDSLVGIRVPPVSDGQLCIAGGHSKALPDAVITAWIATEVGTTLAVIGVGLIDNLITLG